MKAFALFSAATVALAGSCPGSKSAVHAACSLTTTFATSSCEDVATEMIARINGENGWKDPHNGGTYTLTSGSATSDIINTQRVTGNGKYTDLQKFTLTGEGSGCQMVACSESQVFSIVDYSTNYCDLHVLYCGSQDGCPIANTDLSYSESLDSCSQHDKTKCVVAPSVAAVEAPREKGCKPVTPQANFDLDKYMDGKWYIHQQMATKYLPTSWNHCVTAEYSKQSKTFWGYTVAVHNIAYESDKTTQHEAHICAAADSSGIAARLEVAPCFLPKLAAGPYWILAFDHTEGYALVTGGQPTNETPDGCRTGSGVNGSGLWIFTRQQERDETLIQKVRSLAKDQGYDLSVLNDVDQTNCPQ